MLPLIGLAATYLPDLIRLIAADKGGAVADATTAAVAEAAGTTDPVAAEKALQGDPAASAALRARLAKIAIEAQQAQCGDAGGPSKPRDGSGWAAPAVSLIVTLGFFAVIATLVFSDQTLGARSGATVMQILNVSVGTLATGFATVVNFWLGSSQGSRAKDTASQQLQATHAAQLGSIIGTVTSAAARPVGATMPAPKAVEPADNFDRCVAVTLAYEGGFSDNPTDPGGATNFGITKRTLEAFLGHEVAVDDVRAMSSGTAIEIYRANYWNHMRCGDLPAGVDLMVFDYGVNSGPATAIRALQGLVHVAQDGAIGRVTLGAVAQAGAATLVNGLAQTRMAYLRGLATFADFGHGWTRRVDDVQQKARQMAG
jgi:hypothetical protein